MWNEFKIAIFHCKLNIYFQQQYKQTGKKHERKQREMLSYEQDKQNIEWNKQKTNMHGVGAPSTLQRNAINI